MYVMLYKLLRFIDRHVITAPFRHSCLNVIDKKCSFEIKRLFATKQKFSFVNFVKPLHLIMF